MAKRAATARAARDYPKPKMFLGSSTEKGIAVAEILMDVLSRVVTPVPWWDAADFRAMHSTLDGLMSAIERVDFALFVLTPDDRGVSRGKRVLMARDNVLFELGLFLGKLGRKRTFAVIEKGPSGRPSVKIPSDLEGPIIPRFAMSDDADEWRAQIRAAARGIQAIVEEESFRPPSVRPIDQYYIDPKKREFVMIVKAELINANPSVFKGRRLALVVMRPPEGLPYVRETKIVVGPLREIVDREPNNVRLAAPLQSLGDLKKGNLVDGYLLLIPPSVSIGDAETLLEMKRRGCHLLGGGGDQASTGIKM